MGRDLAPGDKVLTYESRTGKTRIEQLVDGALQEIPLRAGRGGIVTAADVVTRFASVDPKDAVHRYKGGSSKTWAWKAETGKPASGFVSLADVNQILGYASGSVLRGFGDRNSGVKQIEKGVYEQLLARFRGSGGNDPPAPGGQPAPPGRRFEGGGEGPEHLALKLYVAANPSEVLGEAGVTTLKVEYPFPSGDQADIVLMDEAGRFIGVEVEIE